MQRIGLLTSTLDPDLIADDRLVEGPLAKLGFEAEAVVWDEPSRMRKRALTEYDGFIFRSCWNYHRKEAEFHAFLGELESTGLPVENTIRNVRWCFHKQYLLEYEQTQIPKTLLLRAGENFESPLRGFLAQFEAGADVVVKPAVSMSGHDTFLYRAVDRTGILEAMTRLRGRDVLVQEFVREIRDTGEVSLVFMGGEFSHASRKHASRGEFRVQEEYGGTRKLFTPTADMLEQAHALLKPVPDPLLYARVDVVERGGELLLMEMEVIDPMLYLHMDPDAPERWAEAIAERFS